MVPLLGPDDFFVVYLLLLRVPYLLHRSHKVLHVLEPQHDCPLPTVILTLFLVLWPLRANGL